MEMMWTMNNINILRDPMIYTAHPMPMKQPNKKEWTKYRDKRNKKFIWILENSL
jgi:hypothetical protein